LKQHFSAVEIAAAFPYFHKAYSNWQHCTITKHIHTDNAHTRKTFKHITYECDEAKEQYNIYVL